MINVIDQDKCIGCGTCFKSCSLDVFRLDTDQSKVSPCMAACPAGTDIRGYNALVQQGKLEEAAQNSVRQTHSPASRAASASIPAKRNARAMPWTVR